jgi:hypothetical protein
MKSRLTITIYTNRENTKAFKKEMHVHLLL